jgi:hypothetical protein
VADGDSPVRQDEDLVIAEAEARIQRRLAEVETADAEGRLLDAIKDVPSVEEQYRMLRGLPG